jgi:hypothetical protein
VKDMKQGAANGGGAAAKSPENYLRFVKDAGLGMGRGGQRQHSIKKSVADSERSSPPPPYFPSLNPPPLLISRR